MKIIAQGHITGEQKLVLSPWALLLLGSDLGSLQDARLARGSEGRGAEPVEGPES